MLHVLIRTYPVALTALVAVSCIQADPDAGDEVVYVNAEGPPIHIDTSVLDAGAEGPDAAAGADDWEAPDIDAGGDTGDESDADLPPVDGELTIGPGDRPARVLLPDDYDPQQRYPAVFLFHSYTMTASGQDSYFGLSDRLNDRQFLLVLPEGTTNVAGQQFWNATDYCCDFYGAGPDDVGYFERLYDELLGETSVDPARIHLVGHSNGSFFAYRLACDHGSKLASITGLAGSGHASPSTCQEPDGTASVLHIHGTHDAVIYYNGVLGAYPSASVMTRRWAERNDCSTSRSIKNYISIDGFVMGTETERRSHNGCADGLDVQLWTIYGGSHVPGLTSGFADYILDFALDKTNQD